MIFIQCDLYNWTWLDEAFFMFQFVEIVALALNCTDKHQPQLTVYGWWTKSKFIAHLVSRNSIWMRRNTECDGVNGCNEMFIEKPNRSVHNREIYEEYSRVVICMCCRLLAAAANKGPNENLWRRFHRNHVRQMDSSFCFCHIYLSCFEWYTFHRNIAISH